MSSEQSKSAHHCSDCGTFEAKQLAANRRKPWGNDSYADLITMAISQSPDQRATLQESEQT